MLPRERGQREHVPGGAEGCLFAAKVMDKDEVVARNKECRGEGGETDSVDVGPPLLAKALCCDGGLAVVVLADKVLPRWRPPCPPPVPVAETVSRGCCQVCVICFIFFSFLSFRASSMLSLI